MGRGSAILLVALGGAAGAVARFVIGDSFARRFGTGWPYGTLVINLTGCFAIALFLSAAAGRAELSPGWRYLFPVGFVGAYTTFSTYEYEIDALRRHGLAGATATRGLVGFGASGKLHEDLTPDAMPDLPITIEAIDDAARIDAALPDVDVLVDDGVVAVHEVQALKGRKRKPKAEAPVTHQKLTGKAKMLRVHVGANDTWEGEPLWEALVKRFHQLDLAGATVYRGLEGYGASGRIHRRPAWRSADEPITVVAVDSAEKIAKALPYLDQMVGSGLVAISDVDVILYRETT